MKLEKVWVCPLCGGLATKVMYAGIPLKLCLDMTCRACFGKWAPLLRFVPFNGILIRYDNYWGTLWRFLTGRL